MKYIKIYGGSIPFPIVISVVVVEIGITISLFLVSASFFILRKKGKVNTTYTQVIAFHILAIIFSLVAITSFIIDIFTEKSSFVKILYVIFFTISSFLHVLLPFRPLYVWIDGIIGRRAKWRFILLPLESIIVALFTAASLFEVIQELFFPSSKYNASIVAASALVVTELTIAGLFFTFLLSIIREYHLSLFITIYDSIRTGLLFICCLGHRRRSNFSYNEDRCSTNTICSKTLSKTSSASSSSSLSSPIASSSTSISPSKIVSPHSSSSSLLSTEDNENSNSDEEMDKDWINFNTKKKKKSHSQYQSKSHISIIQYQTIRRIVLVCFVVFLCTVFGITKGVCDIIITSQRVHALHYDDRFYIVLYIIGSIGECGTLTAALLLALALTIPHRIRKPQSFRNDP